MAHRVPRPTPLVMFMRIVWAPTLFVGHTLHFLFEGFMGYQAGAIRTAHNGAGVRGRIDALLDRNILH